MAIPANPSLTAIVTEGLLQAGENNPSASLLTRSKNEWIEQIKNDLWQDVQQPKYLQITSYGVLVKGQSRYSCPADFSNDLTLDLLDGDIAGTLSAGSSNSATIPSTVNVSEVDLIGRGILITGGTGVGSYAEGISWDSATRVLTVAPNFSLAPALGSTFMIVNREFHVDQKHLADYNYWRQLGTGQPCCFFPIGDEDFGEFIFNQPPDKNYGARLRYYANIMKIDVDSTLMSTLYLQWRNFWIKGVKYLHLSDNDDTRQSDARAEYKSLLMQIRMKQTYGHDLHALQQRVSDYA